MRKRELAPNLTEAARSYPVLTLTGPRQSGKTTLVRDTFPDHAYVSLEAPDVRQFALEDPRGFLAQHTGGVILDEVQNTPDLMSYIQVMVDEDPTPGRFILTGSQNLALLEQVTQTLAGRTALHRLLPFSRAEITGRHSMAPWDIGEILPKGGASGDDLFDALFTGFYPRIHDQNLAPDEWLRNYYQTYVERDVRRIVNVGDIELFGRFVRLCAGRSGQLLNLSSLASDGGVSHSTARRWISVLEAGFVVYLLRPHFKNFNKRLVKSPKLYFYDTGLACHLLGIRRPDELLTHPLRGPVFETFVLGELLKAYTNRGESPSVYFWRDAAGQEIDFLLDHGTTFTAVEAKSSATIASDFFRAIDNWRALLGQDDTPAALVYGGAESMRRRGTAVYSWSAWL